MFGYLDVRRLSYRSATLKVIRHQSSFAWGKRFNTSWASSYLELFPLLQWRFWGKKKKKKSKIHLRHKIIHRKYQHGCELLSLVLKHIYLTHAVPHIPGRCVGKPKVKCLAREHLISSHRGEGRELLIQFLRPNFPQPESITVPAWNSSSVQQCWHATMYIHTQTLTFLSLWRFLSPLHAELGYMIQCLLNRAYL